MAAIFIPKKRANSRYDVTISLFSLERKSRAFRAISTSRPGHSSRGGYPVTFASVERKGFERERERERIRAGQIVVAGMRRKPRERLLTVARSPIYRRRFSSPPTYAFRFVYREIMKAQRARERERERERRRKRWPAEENGIEDTRESRLG